MASAISSGGTLADFQGKNQDAAPFNWFTSAIVCWMHGNSLFHVLVAVTNDSSFWEFLCVAHSTGWSVFWNKNADIDMD